MAALLNTSLVDPRAQRLYGGGNTDISDADIKAFISQPGMTADQIYKKALETGVSSKQIAKAMYGTPGYDSRTIDDYISKQGVSLAQVKRAPTVAPQPATNRVPVKSILAPTPPAVSPAVAAALAARKEYAGDATPATYEPAAAPPPVRPSSIKLTPADTVAGQLDTIIRDPNSPLLRQAQTYGIESANRRGLSNSSIAASAGESALLNAATPIAAQDANTNFASKSQNSQLVQNANLFNADTLAKMNMFNSDLGAKTSMFNSDLGAKIGMFNADLGTKTNMFNADLGSKTNMFNADTASKTGMFNADLGARVGMFNAGNNKDVLINDANLEANRFIATMDTDTKLKIANIQAQAQDSGILGQISSNMMELVYKIGADPNIAPNVKQQMVNDVMAQGNSTISLLGSFAKVGKLVTFGTPQGESNTAAPANAQGTGSTPNTAATGNAASNIPAPDVNVLGYQVEPAVAGNVIAYEKATGQKVDKSRVAPEALVMDIKSIGTGPTNYLSSDGTVKVANNNAYDVNGLMQKYKATSLGDLFDRMFVPIHPPGTMRADAPMFYMFR